MKKTALICLLIVALLLGSIGGTMAYLNHVTERTASSYTVGSVRTEMMAETGSVRVRNEGSAPVYVRVAVIANWVDGAGNILAPWAGSVPCDAAHWAQSGGYYYLREALAPGETSPDLLTAPIPATSAPVENAQFALTLLHQSIQAEPASAVTDAWGWTPDMP